MLTALDLALLLAAALAYLSYVGYGPARLLLKGEDGLPPLYALPLAGLAVAIIAFSFLNNTFVPMRPATWALAVAATACNAAVVLRTRSLGLPKPGLRDLLLLSFTVASYGLAGAPLVHAGTTAFVGGQWDLEIYLPLTEYLKRYAIGSGVSGPPNPLLDVINSAPVRGGSGWGFSYIEAAVGTLLDRPSHLTFRPMLHVFFALSVPAVYLFCRHGLRMAAVPALAAAGLSGINGLNLWIASIGLAGHTAALVLLPAAIAATIEALRKPGVRNTLLAGIFVAALLLSFYTGSLLIYSAAAAGVGLAFLLRRGAGRRNVLVAGAGIAAFSLALSIVSHLRFLEVLPLYFQNGLSEGWRVDGYSPLSEILGLTPYQFVTNMVPPERYWGERWPVAVAGWAAILSLGTLAFIVASALAPLGDRRALFGLAGAFILLALYLRYGAQYSYGYFKLGSLGVFLLNAALAQGAAAVWAAVTRWSFGRPGAAPARPRLGAALGGFHAGFLLFLLAILLANTGMTLRFFWDEDPGELPRSVWELGGLRDALAPGSSVFLGNGSTPDPREAAILAYFLMDHPLKGSVRTAYGGLEGNTPGEDFEYVVLRSGERPEARGLSPADLVWVNELAALYRRPESWLAAIELDGSRQAIRMRAGQPVALDLSRDAWKLSDGARELMGGYATAASHQRLELAFLTFEETTAEVRAGDGVQRTRLPAGLVSYRTPAFPTPASLALAIADAQAPAWLLAVRVLDGRESSAQIVQGRDIFALHAGTRFSGTTAMLDLAYWVSETREGDLALALEIYRRGRSTLEPAAYWEIARASGRTANRQRFILDLAGWRCGPTPQRLAPGRGGMPPDGEYEAQLAAYYVSEQVGRWPAFRFSVADGRVVRTEPVTESPYSILYLDTPGDIRSLAGAIPPGVRVYAPAPPRPERSFITAAAASLPRGTIVAAGDAPPGARFPFTLLPSDEDPGQWGVAGATRVWTSEHAVLYEGPVSVQPVDVYAGAAAREGAGVRGSLAAAARLEGGQLRLDARYAGPVPVGALLGIDLYGMEACAPQHYGWWALPLAGASAGISFSLDVPAQMGTVQEPDAQALLGHQTWPVADGKFRGFIFVKIGEDFHTYPAFELTLEGGQVAGFRSFPVAADVELGPR